MKNQAKEKDQLLKHLKDIPIVGAACGRVGISRSTYYRWCEDDAAFKRKTEAAIRLGNKSMNDLAYGKLIKQIQQDKLAAVTFYLARRHPLFKKKMQKLKVDMEHKVPQIEELPEDVFADIAISKLPKRLRRQVVKKQMKLSDVLNKVFQKVAKEHPAVKPEVIHDRIPWEKVIKLVLEEDEEKKD